MLRPGATAVPSHTHPALFISNHTTVLDSNERVDDGRPATLLASSAPGALAAAPRYALKLLKLPPTPAINDVDSSPRPDTLAGGTTAQDRLTPVDSVIGDDQADEGGGEGAGTIDGLAVAEEVGVTLTDADVLRVAVTEVLPVADTVVSHRWPQG